MYNGDSYRIVLLLIALPLLTLLNVSVAQAQEPNIEDQVLRISKNLYCPVCPATPLDVCETQACVQWRALIRGKLLAGENEDQIRAYFIAQYGERVLGAPTPQGFNLGVYIFPALMLLAGVTVLAFTMRNWSKKRLHPEAMVLSNSIPKEYADRIARALEESD